MTHRITNTEFRDLQLADQWVITVQDEIDAMPTALADVTAAYEVGWQDAALGKTCQPTTHYIKLGQVEDYICGHKDCVKAMADAAEYQDYFADQAWARGGF